jgi:CubicO group peptidase (beta-lactamase class C family)
MGTRHASGMPARVLLTVVARCTAVLLAGVLLGARPLPAQRALPADLDRYIERAMRDWEVPGLAIAIVRRDSVLLAKGYGVRELGQSRPIDEHTLFSIASCTKAFTATAAGMLVDDGKLSWDDPVITHLPHFQTSDPWVTREFTMRDLLAHRSGLERGDFLWFGTDYDRDAVVRHLRYLAPVAGFRSTYGYSNNMYITAGQVIAAISGRAWDDVVRERIFGPLGMTRSNTSVRDLAGADNVAMPHEVITGQVRPVPYRSLDNEAPGGAINSSVVEMSRWIRLQLAGGVFEGKRLVHAATLAETHAPQTIIRVTPEAEKAYPGVHFMAYGMGWQLQDYRARKLVQHNGAIDGMRAVVAMLPEEGIGLVILANKGRGNRLHDALRNRILDALLGAPPRDWSTEYLEESKRDEARVVTAQKELEQKRVKGTSPSLPLEKYAGQYAHRAYGTATVTLERGKLVVRLGPVHTGDLEHWHYDTFRTVWRNPYLGSEPINFVLDAGGNVEEMRLPGFATFRRVTATPR